MIGIKAFSEKAVQKGDMKMLVHVFFLHGDFILKALKFSSIIISNTPNKQKFLFETYPFSVSSCRSLPKVWILYMIIFPN